MSKFTWFLTVLAVSMIASSASAVGKITVDPNTPGARVREAAPETDARLDQKVTYEARRKTVSVILDDLSEKTGVTFRAGYNSKDWQVRDRKINIFAKDLPLRDLMDSIARVMKFKWERSEKDGVHSYRLYMDRKTLLGAERARLAEEECLRKRQNEAREKVLDGMVAAATMSDADLAKLKKDSPFIYTMSKIGYASSMSSLFAEVPAAKQAWLSGEKLSLGIGSLPGSVQQGLKKSVDQLFAFVGKLTGDPIPSDITDRLFEGNVIINHSLMTNGYDSDSFIGDITFDFQPVGTVKSDFPEPDSDVAKFLAKRFGEFEAGALPVDKEALNKLNKDAEQVFRTQKIDLGEPLNEHIDDPALAAKVRIKVEGRTFADALAALAESSGFAVISDGFEKSFQGLSFPEDEMELRAALDKIETVCHYNWERNGSRLEFRDRGWFRKRAAQIPEAWLEPWRKAFIENGTLSIDDMSQIALLTVEQYWANVLPDDVLGTGMLANLISYNWDLLRAHACLTDAQKSALFAEEGLDLGSISPTQWTTLTPIFRGNVAFTEGTGAGCRLAAKQEQDGKQLKYTLKATSPAQNGPMTWSFTTPSYEPPRKEGPKKKGPKTEAGGS